MLSDCLKGLQGVNQQQAMREIWVANPHLSTRRWFWTAIRTMRVMMMIAPKQSLQRGLCRRGPMMTMSDWVNYMVARPQVS